MMPHACDSLLGGLLTEHALLKLARSVHGQHCSDGSHMASCMVYCMDMRRQHSTNPWHTVLSSVFAGWQDV